jgi:hypothetical protein
VAHLERSVKDMKFPVLALSAKKLTWLFRSEGEIKRLPVAFVRIFLKKKEELEFFDSDGSSWALEAIETVQPVPFWLRIWPSLREIDVQMRFTPLAQDSFPKMKAILKRALEADDDLLTQHHEREEILAKLADTKSTSEVFRLYRWMMKDFRKGPNQTPEPTAPSGRG